MSFATEIIAEQIAWRKRSLPTVTALGRWQGVDRLHLLPPELWEHNLWTGIATGSAHSLPEYLGSRIQPHTGKHHLNSSWILCANLYFPFAASADGRSIAAAFLREHVHPEISDVTAIELEFELGGNLHPRVALGESGGSRGQGQTSPDVAFVTRNASGRGGLVLTESKYCEESFYECSAYRAPETKRRTPNPDSSRCRHVAAVIENPAAQCHQSEWGRKYWEVLAPSATGARKLPHCPAIDAYQLFRQQALAEAVASSSEFEPVVTAVAFDRRNATLIGSLSDLGVSDFAAGWGSLFSGKAMFRTFTHQQWVSWVRAQPSAGNWREWSDYVQDRYGY